MISRIIWFFRNHIRLGDPNSLLSRPFAASPRHRFAPSPAPRIFASFRTPGSFCQRVALMACILALLTPLGCGYHLAGTGGQAPGDIQSIAVNKLVNRTGEVGLENIFTNALLNQFIRWKRLPVKSSNEADAVLTGSVAGIRIQRFSHVTSTQTLQSRVTITLSLTLRRVDTDEILWQNKNLSYYNEYVETGNALETDQLRNAAISRIAVFLAEKVHQDMFEEF